MGMDISQFNYIYALINNISTLDSIPRTLASTCQGFKSVESKDDGGISSHPFKAAISGRLLRVQRKSKTRKMAKHTQATVALHRRLRYLMPSKSRMISGDDGARTTQTSMKYRRFLPFRRSKMQGTRVRASALSWMLVHSKRSMLISQSIQP